MAKTEHKPVKHPILYSFRRCPYAMRARLALKISGTECELREVVLRNKPPEMLEVSDKGTVPVLIDTDGSIIDESLDVMLWALNKADPDGWLGGNMESMLTLIETFDLNFKPQLDRYKYPNRYDNEDAELARAKAAEFLYELDSRLTNSHYLFGPSITLADMALLPFVRQFANTDRAWFDRQSWARLNAWLTFLLSSDLFQSIMKKYDRWQAPASGVLFLRSIENADRV